MNKTQIYSIIQKPFESNTGWYTRVSFSINKNSEYFNYFIEETKDIINPLLSFNEEGNVFIFSQAITSSPASEGIITYLEELIDETNVKGNFSLESNILRCLKALSQFWD